MRFDTIVSNPPYNRNLDLKILQSVYDLSDRFCILHPVLYLYNKKPKSRFDGFRDKIKTSLQSVDVIRYIYKLFNLPYFGSIVAIVYIDKNTPTDFDYETLDLHGTSEIYKSIRDKIINYCQTHMTCGQSIGSKDVKEFILKTTQFGGCGWGMNDDENKNENGFHHENKSNLYLMIPKNYNSITQSAGYQFSMCQYGGNGHDYNSGDVGGKWEHPASNYNMVNKGKENINYTVNNTNEIGQFNYYFDTEQEAINFRNYLKTKMARFCLSIYKIGRYITHQELESVPYLPTYTRAWTDKEVADEIGLTEDELQWCLNWIPNFYIEDFEIYK